MANNEMVKGATVKVLRGKKVPLNTVGIVFWMEDGQWGLRLGIKNDSGVFWTAAKNCVVVDAVVDEARPGLPFEPEPVAPVVAASAGDRMALLEARIFALEMQLSVLTKVAA
jgi:hypothetical protein